MKGPDFGVRVVAMEKTIHRGVGGDEMMDILGNIPLPEEQGASGGNKTEVKEDPYKDVKDGSLGNRVLNWIADWGKSSDTVSKCTSGSICAVKPLRSCSLACANLSLPSRSCTESVSLSMARA